MLLALPSVWRSDGLVAKRRVYLLCVLDVAYYCLCARTVGIGPRTRRRPVARSATPPSQCSTAGTIAGCVATPPVDRKRSPTRSRETQAAGVFFVLMRLISDVRLRGGIRHMQAMMHLCTCRRARTRPRVHVVGSLDAYKVSILLTVRGSCAHCRSQRMSPASSGVGLGFCVGRCPPQPSSFDEGLRGLCSCVRRSMP